MSNRAFWSAFVVAGLLGVAASVVAAQDASPQPWLHVQVTGEDDGAENVAVNVPLSAAEPLFALVPHRILPDGQLSLAGREVPVNVGAMRDLWRVLMEVGDTEFVTVDGEDETVRIAREGDRITVQVEDRGEEGAETVDIQLPIAVVDALLAEERRHARRAGRGRAAGRAARRHRPGQRGRATGPYLD